MEGRKKRTVVDQINSDIPYWENPQINGDLMDLLFYFCFWNLTSVKSACSLK